MPAARGSNGQGEQGRQVWVQAARDRRGARPGSDTPSRRRLYSSGIAVSATIRPNKKIAASIALPVNYGEQAVRRANGDSDQSVETGRADGFVGFQQRFAELNPPLAGDLRLELREHEIARA